MCPSSHDKWFFNILSICGSIWSFFISYTPMTSLILGEMMPMPLVKSKTRSGPNAVSNMSCADMAVAFPNEQRGVELSPQGCCFRASIAPAPALICGLCTRFCVVESNSVLEFAPVKRRHQSHSCMSAAVDDQPRLRPRTSR